MFVERGNSTEAVNHFSGVRSHIELQEGDSLTMGNEELGKQKSCRDFYFLEEGALGLCTYDLEGRVGITHFYTGESDLVWAGPLEDWEDFSTRHEFIALVPTKVLRVPEEEMQSELENNPERALQMMRSLRSSLVQANETLSEEQATYRGAKERILRLLQTMSGFIDDGTFAPSQQDVADYLGLSRITVNSIFGKLRDEGVISGAQWDSRQQITLHVTSE